MPEPDIYKKYVNAVVKCRIGSTHNQKQQELTVDKILNYKPSLLSKVVDVEKEEQLFHSHQIAVYPGYNHFKSRETYIVFLCNC